jgi:hypothetical protein
MGWFCLGSAIASPPHLHHLSSVASTQGKDFSRRHVNITLSPALVYPSPALGYPSPALGYPSPELVATPTSITPSRMSLEGIVLEARVLGGLKGKGVVGDFLRGIARGRG